MSKQGTNTHKGVKKTKIFMRYEHRKMSVFVTPFRGTRPPWVGVILTLPLVHRKVCRNILRR